jgi:hypothetical protein
MPFHFFDVQKYSHGFTNLQSRINVLYRLAYTVPFDDNSFSSFTSKYHQSHCNQNNYKLSGFKTAFVEETQTVGREGDKNILVIHSKSVIMLM